jgi:transcriptional regulator with PAS, ATPase and Fis domain
VTNTETLSLIVTGQDRAHLVSRRWCVEVVGGADAGKRSSADAGTIIVGSHIDCDLVLTDPTVSRYHAEIALHPEGVEVKDLDSKNGLFHANRRTKIAFVRAGDTIRVGQTTLAFSTEDAPLATKETERLGDFVTRSSELKATLGALSLASKTETTILIEGETGTGKEVLARAIHGASNRASGPLVVVDCSAIQETLLETHLFGHLKGSFTGAVSDHAGAFESAHRGTVFIDELGELPLLLQPKLLRVLEARAVTRIGDVRARPVDVRFVAATNRSLDDMVRAKTFRADLFYRVAVVRARIPPLRERRDDIPLLLEHHAKKYGMKPMSPGAIAALTAYDWPGNVRELRNVVERLAALFQGTVIDTKDLFLAPTEPAGGDEPVADYHEAKDRVIAEFERSYVKNLLARHQGNLSQAAAAAGLSRNALYALMKRSGVGSE